MTNIKDLKKRYWARMTLWQKIKSFFDMRFRVETWLEVRRAKKQSQFEMFYAPPIKKRKPYSKDGGWHLNPWKHLKD